MSKVITFSRYFPAYHPRAGQPTKFVEKIYRSFDQMADVDLHKTLYQLNPDVPFSAIDDFIESLGTNVMRTKGHTIRAGKRFKAGEMFSPRVWSGKPYNSKQIIIGPDVKITETLDFRIDGGGNIYLDDWFVYMDNHGTDILNIHTIAKNDGLNKKDLLAWFKHPKPFDGQVICWHEEVVYG